MAEPRLHSQHWNAAEECPGCGCRFRAVLAEQTASADKWFASWRDAYNNAERYRCALREIVEIVESNGYGLDVISAARRALRADDVDPLSREGCV